MEDEEREYRRTPAQHVVVAWKEWVQVIFAIVIGIEMFVVFDSFFLMLITLAFFFYIPRAPRANTWIFISVMIVIPFLAFANSASMGLGLEMGESFYPWEWNSAAIIFMGMWLLAFVAGLEGSDIESRQVMGLILIFTSFFIFSIGIGTQEVGQAFFGPWWPTVYTGAADLFEPMSEAWSQLQQTMGLGWKMFTDPYGYAQGIVSGNYVRDPTTGLEGAYGVEIESFTSTPIFIEAPFSLSMIVKNKGAFEADNVRVAIFSTQKAAREERTIGDYVPIQALGDVHIPFALGDRIPVEAYGFDDTDNTNAFACNMGVCGGGLFEDNMDDEGLGKQTFDLEKLDSRQLLFKSDHGVSCETILEYELTDKFIPIMGMVQYEYSIYSTLDMSIMSKDEWNRQIADGSLETQYKKPSKLTNAPVRLNIDTLEQPIREGTPFFIGLSLLSAQGDNSDVTNATVRLEYPQSFNLLTCVPQASSSLGNVVTWNDFKPYVPAYCQFSGVKGLDSPSETFLIRANASYTFSKWKTLNTKFEFGGKDCEGVTSGITDVTALECNQIPQNYWTGYNTYKNDIKSAIIQTDLNNVNIVDKTALL
ncbi:MAG: hypothetical protein KKC05_04025, partial [Nanoarchaeota archaeon]|nr:hypothetical protein [Nanoarchaeota archaeon]